VILELLLLLLIAWLVWLYVEYWSDSPTSDYLQTYHTVPLHKPRCSTCLGQSTATHDGASATAKNTSNGLNESHDANLRKGGNITPSTQFAEDTANHAVAVGKPVADNHSQNGVGDRHKYEANRNGIAHNGAHGNASEVNRSTWDNSAANAKQSSAKPPLEDADSAKQQRVKPLFTAPAESDDLQQIKGIGKVMEKTLNDLGVTTFEQLANFTEEDIFRVTEALDGFTGRIERDRWIEQAKSLRA